MAAIHRFKEGLSQLEDRTPAVQTLAQRQGGHGAVTYPTARALTYTHRAA